MTCNCGQRGFRPHRVWCDLRLAEVKAAEAQGLRNALGFYGFCAAALFFVAYRSEIAGWWLAWRTVIGWGMVYGLPVLGLCWVAYRRRR